MFSLFGWWFRRPSLSPKSRQSANEGRRARLSLNALEDRRTAGSFLVEALALSMPELFALPQGGLVAETEMIALVNQPLSPVALTSSPPLPCAESALIGPVHQESYPPAIPSLPLSTSSNFTAEADWESPWDTTSPLPFQSWVSAALDNAAGNSSGAMASEAPQAAPQGPEPVIGPGAPSAAGAQETTSLATLAGQGGGGAFTRGGGDLPLGAAPAEGSTGQVGLWGQFNPDKQGPIAKKWLRQVLVGQALAFEQNKGQAQPEVDYLARGPGYSVFLKSNEAAFSLATGKKPKGDGRPGDEIKQHVVRMQLFGATDTAQSLGSEIQPTRAHYFRGGEPEWRTNVARYGRVDYHGVYDGIDVSYYGNDGQLEFDFVVQPGAEVSRIALRFEGPDSAKLENTGELVLKVGKGEVTLPAPRLYQPGQGGGREEVSGRFVAWKDGTIGFEVDHYDPSRPLVIDPVVLYGAALNGAGNEEGWGVAGSPDGGAYVTGWTTSPDLPVGSGSMSGPSDAFVWKLSVNGALEYCAYLGGSGNDAGLAIAVDDAGNVYVLGYTDSSNFATTAGAYRTAMLGVADHFVVKLSPSGSSLLYSTLLDGSVSAAAVPFFEARGGIAVTPGGRVWAAANTASPGLQTLIAWQPTYGGGASDGYVVSLDDTGAQALVVTYLGGGGADQVRGAADDLNGNVYFVGQTGAPPPGGAAFPVTIGAFDPTLSGPTDAFIVKASSSGERLYATLLGGTGDDGAFAVAVDHFGQAVVTGGTASGDFPIAPGAFDPSLNGPRDAFLTTFTADGSGLAASSYYGGGANEEGHAVAISPTGEVVFTGVTSSPDLLQLLPMQPGYGGGPNDGFLATVRDGVALWQSTFLGGLQSDAAHAIVVDTTGGVHVAGTTDSPNFPVPGPLLGGTAAFTLKLATEPIARDDAFATLHDRPLRVDLGGVRQNDLFPGGGAAASLVVPPQHGSIQFALDGTFTYSPHLHFVGTDSFQYRLSDGTTTTAPATVTLTVTNSSPVGEAESYSLMQGGSLSIGGRGVLANDQDDDNDSLTAQLVSGPAHGALTLSANGTFSYTPGAGYSGPDSFSYAPNDGVGNGAAVSVALTVRASNQAPVSVADSFTVLHDSTLTVAQGALANDTDADGDLLSAILVSGVTHGSLTLSQDGSFRYAPAAGYVGVDSFCYKSNDGTADGNTVSVTLTVGDAAPVGAADNYTVAHDRANEVSAVQGLLINDADADGDRLTAQLVSGPAHGLLTLSDDGSFTYTPSAGYTGPDSFQYAPRDGAITGAAVTVSLTVDDTAPLAVAESYGVLQDTPRTLGGPGVLRNDSDPDGDALTASVATGPAHGSLTLAADGSFTYTPAVGYAGPDSFIYRASDGALSATATVTLTVHAGNSAPAGQSDSYSVPHDRTLAPSVGVLANDSDADGDPFTATLAAGPAHGTLSLSLEGTFSYFPEPGYVGPDSFTYTLSDGSAQSGPVVVSLSITNAEAPVAWPDEFEVGRNTPLEVGGAGVLENDLDEDGDALTALLVAGPAFGTLTLNDDGSFLYAPQPGYLGADSFTYQASDGVLASAATTVTLSIGNTAPAAAGETFVALQAATLQVPAGVLLANDSDAEVDALSATLAAGPAHGTLTLNADGSFSYTPDTGFLGADSFTYRASDGLLHSVEAGVILSVVASNSTPTATADSYTLPHDQALEVAAADGLLANDTNPDEGPLWVTPGTGPTHGVLTLNSDGSFLYVPDAGYSGPVAFTYNLSDGPSSTTATVSLSVTDAAPEAADDWFSVLASGTTTVELERGVLANDADEEGDALEAQLVDGPTHGSLTLQGDGSFSYTPDATFAGADSFTYRAVAGGQQSAVATVSLSAGPVAGDNFYTAQHDLAFVTDHYGGVLWNDDAASGSTLTAALVSGPTHGALTLHSDGSFIYEPDAGYLGADSFTYRAVAGSAQSNVATVQLEVVNVVPEAPDTQYQVNAGEALEGELSEIASDSDLEDDLHFVLDASPAHGTLSYFRDDGTFEYQPDAGFLGEDFFTYHVADGAQASTVGKVMVRAVGRAPVAVGISYDVAKDTELVVGLNDRLLTLYAAYDLDGDVLTAKVVSSPTNAGANGFQLNADGTFRYTPAVGFEGEDSFTFTVSDGGRTSAQATVKLLVSSHPAAHEDVYLLPATGALVEGRYRGLLANDFYPGDPPLPQRRAVIVEGPSSGAVETLNDGVGTGAFTYTPAAGQPLPDEVTFTYRAALLEESCGCEMDGSEPVTVRLLRKAAAPKLTLVEEALSKGALTITKDKGDGTYRTGWRPGDKGPQAVAFVAGSKATLAAQFKVDKPELLGEYLYGIRGDNPLLNPVQFDDQGIVLDRQAKTLTVTWHGARVGPSPLVSLEVKQHWRFGSTVYHTPQAPPWVMPTADTLSVDGTSSYNLYTLDAKPVNTPKLYHTLAAIGTKAAQQQAAALRVGITHGLLLAMRLLGENWTPQQFQEKLDAEWAKRRTVYGFEDSIKQGVMAAFSTLRVQRADGGAVMNYYGDWGPALKNLTTAALLENADGMCNAWAMFFVDVLRAQGINVRNARRVITPKAGAAFQMYVKRWKPDGAGNSNREDKGTFPYLNKYTVVSKKPAIDMVDFPNNKYKWAAGWEYVKKQKGEVRGQGTSKYDPLAIFGDHVEVELKVRGETVFFDPSYGKQYEGATESDRLAALQVGALDFLGLHTLEKKGGKTVLVRFWSTDSMDVELKATPIKD